MKKNMLIISYSHLKSDPRVYRQIETFKDIYNVTTIGYSSSDIKGVKHYSINRKKINLFTRIRYRFLRKILLRLKLFERNYWLNPLVIDSFKKMKDMNFDIIIANDINTLPLALKIKKKAKVLFDAHEYFPRHYEHDLNWVKYYQEYNKYICKNYMPLADKVITVGTGIAKEYEKQYALKSIEIITNAPKYSDIYPSEINKRIALIHHGSAHPARKIERMIYAMDFVDSKYHLTLMLVPTNKRYYEQIKQLVEVRRNVDLISPVSMNEIITKSNSYDVGIAFFPPTTFNLENALPNKFFEYIQAKLMILIGPSLEMQHYVKDYQLGIISDSYDVKSLSRAINSINTESILLYKQSAVKASQILNSEKNMDKLKQLVIKLIDEH